VKYLSRSFVISALVLAMLLSAACASWSRSSLPSIAPAPPPLGAPAASGISASKSMGPTYNGQDSGAGGIPGDMTPDDRKIVMTGSIAMDVADVGKAIDAITAIANQFNGYVVSSNQYAETDTPTGRISIRVPSGKFVEAFQKVKSAAIKVTNENTNSQDVTEQYMDLQAQLHNLEATEAQYLELLKKADNVKDMLEVQRELSNVRGSIERTRGRIQYIERTADMSLIDVSLKRTNPIGQSTWDITGIFKSAVDGLIVFGKVLISVLIWVLVFAPIWIIVLVIIFIVRRKRNKSKLAAPK
jgi:hypothetical protein